MTKVENYSNELKGHILKSVKERSVELPKTKVNGLRRGPNQFATTGTSAAAADHAIEYQRSAKPHARAAAATSASSASPAPSTTASHTARAALRSDALRNRATVRNRGTCISAHMNSLAAAGGAAAASTGISDARSAGSSEAWKSAGRNEGGIVCAHQV